MTIPRSNAKDVYEGAEDSTFLARGSAFSKSFVSAYPKSPRFVKCFLENIEGKSVYIPRYLRRLQPPADVWYEVESGGKKNNKAIEQAARYVSLIPYKEDSALFRDMPDLTCTSQEFLDLGAGDSEEHAMLLCNYFNFIDRQQSRQGNACKVDGVDRDINSYIIYGEAVPDGEAWFVARRCRKGKECEIWNPMTGECYSFDRKEYKV